MYNYTPYAVGSVGMTILLLPVVANLHVFFSLLLQYWLLLGKNAKSNDDILNRLFRNGLLS